MALCEQCGSISIVLAKREPADKFFGLFSSRRPFVCRRCGWRGRRDWSDRDLLDLSNYGTGGAEPDPALAILDAPPGRKSRKRKRRKPAAFGLSQLDLASAGPPPEDDSSVAPSRSSRSQRPRSLRRKNSRWREIVATIAVTALVMFLVVILGLTGSCTGGGSEAM